MWGWQGYDGSTELGGLESGAWTTGGMVYLKAGMLWGRLGGREEWVV